MKVFNARIGFACNSSSTHSVVILPSDHKEKDSQEHTDFGWEDFTLVSPEMKSKYLDYQIAQALSRAGLAPEIIRALCPSWSEPEEGYIDHQSEWALPESRHGVGIDQGFVADLRQFIMRPDVAILGGKDNEGSNNPLKRSPKPSWFTDLPLEEDGWIARKDGVYWTLFNRETGNKIRLSFDDNAPPFTKASRPELIDVKVTNHCTSGCPWCYQGSTPGGKELTHCGALVGALAAVEPFEVAIGGGEPAAWPLLSGFLEALDRTGIVPNFTTRQIDWLRDPVRARRILGTKPRGSFAVSIDDGNVVKKIEEAAIAVQMATQTLGYEPTWAVQHVLTDPRIGGMCEACTRHGVPLVLLRFKTDGRGERWGSANQYFLKRVAEAEQKWMEHIPKDNFPQIGIDTALAQRCEQQLKHSKINPELWEKSEGAFSCYIDAVEGTIAPSSWGEGAKQKRPLKIDYDSGPEIIAAFRSFQEGK